MSVSLFLFCKQIHLCYFLDSTCGGYNVIFVFNFSQYDNLQVHPCCCKWHYFLLFFFNCQVVYLLYPFLCQWTCKLLPCLGYCIQCCFEQLECIYLFELQFSLDICSRVGLLYHMVTLFLVFLRNLDMFSIVAIPVDIPINSVGGFPFIHTFSSIYYFQTV